jgi:hypothetical protein
MNGLEAQLFARIKGQDHVIPRVGSVLERGQLGLPPAAQPLGSLLFLGPTGLGKTGSALESLHFFTARLPLSFRYVGFLHLDSAKLFMGMNPANPGDSERSSLSTIKGFCFSTKSKRPIA